MATELPAVGIVFVDKYRLDAVLGEGGFARVYRATDVALDRSVAIKVLKPTDGDAAQARVGARFLREMRVVASLIGPHVVRMFDFGRTPAGLMFIAFEALGGEDLDELMRRGPLKEEEVVHIMRQVLDALKEAHSLGLLHRDIKPGNIRIAGSVNDPMFVKLMDFGIAKSAHDDASLTATGRVVGTPRFMAPEQLFGEPLTASTDLFALGLVAMEMLTGRESEHIQALSNNAPIGLTPADGVSEALAGVINRMLSVEPGARFGSAGAVLVALDRMSAPSETVAANPPAPLVRSDIARRRLAGVAAVAALVVTVGLATVWSLKSAEPPPPAPPRAVRVPPALIVAQADEPPPEPEQPVIEDAAPDGCGQPPPFLGSAPMREMDGLDRLEWAVHVPRPYDPARKHPVMLLFHDDASTGARLVQQSALGDTADGHGFVIVAPNDDDVAYVWTEREDLDRARAALHATAQKLCLDLEQIVAVGFGSGAAGPELFSCSDQLLGAVLASYSPDRPAFRCQPERAIPMLWLAPTNTGFQPVDGGKDCVGSPKVSFDRYEQMWRDRNHCEPRADPWFEYERSVCRSWGCGATPFVSCRIDGGRGWPGAPPRTLDLFKCDGPPSDFPQNETIWRFMASLGVSQR